MMKGRTLLCIAAAAVMMCGCASDDSSNTDSEAVPAAAEVCEPKEKAAAVEPVLFTGTLEEVHEEPVRCLLNVECILQKPELPMGCEIVSLAIVLNHLGIETDKLDLAENYLEKTEFYFKNGELFGGDPSLTFPGDPASEFSSGCFPYAIFKAANAYLKDKVSDLRSKICGSLSLGKLLHDYIDRGIPVVVWTTSRLRKIQYEYSWKTEGGYTIRFPKYEHCLVLVGYDEEAGLVYTDDPLLGRKQYDRSLFEQRYNELGRHALVVLSKEQEREIKESRKE
ncbi:MAG: C39 family peptidase [Ruminococcus sp.]|nr:C39 family peptidase [Ruminococcus sp.]